MGSFGLRVVCVVTPVLLVVACVVCFSFVCIFQCFADVGPLCSCVCQGLSEHIKIVYVTTFFIIKNMIRHSH